jgi:hypothetical protein
VLRIPPKGERPAPELLLQSREHFDRALTWYFVEYPHAHYELRSAGTVYRFYLFRSERRNGPRFVACKAVTTPRSAAVDAYGKAVTHRRACDECGAAFEKRGRRKFCSTQCGARARKRRFLGKPAPQRRHRPTWRYTEQTESEIWRNHAIQTAAATRKDWRG